MRKQNQDYVGGLRLAGLTEQVFVRPDFAFREEYARIAAGLQ